MQARIFYLFLIILISGAKSHNDVTKWSMGLRFLQKNCPLVPWKDPAHGKFLKTLQNCLQRQVLIPVDAFFDEDIIPIFDGIDLVRLDKTSNSSDSDELNSNEIDTGRRDEGGDLWEILRNRISRIFRNRVLKFDMGHLTGLAEVKSSKSSQFEGRRRRKKQGMMMMMMMGLLLMGTVLIPMGFQFLAVLGGKALLLAKMALMLSSIQGLKRVATSGVNYGLYHSPEAWHERSHLEPSQQIYEIPYHPYPHMDRRH